MATPVTLARLRELGISTNALQSVSPTDQQLACDMGWQTAEGYLRAAGYPLPLPAQAIAQALPLIEHSLSIGVRALMKVRGFDPTSPGNAEIVNSYDNAILYFKDIASKKTIPFDLNSDGNPIGTDPVADTATGTNDYAIASDPSRRW